MVVYSYVKLVAARDDLKLIPFLRLDANRLGFLGSGSLARETEDGRLAFDIHQPDAVACALDQAVGAHVEAGAGRRIGLEFNAEMEVEEVGTFRAKNGRQQA